MKKRFTIIWLILLICLAGFAQLPQVASGTIRRFENFPSRYLQPRNVDVWLPEHYDAKKHYAVLYMHDGQMLFDSATTWNHQDWKVDETLSELLQKGKIKNTIVVAIWNNGAYRHTDYFPQKPLAYLPTAFRDTLIAQELMNQPQADNYLLFLTKELKPFIDSAFSTYQDKAHTFIAGSSMGGLISLYALCEYPEVFGGAACLSTHWPGSLRQNNDLIPKAFATYVSGHLPSPQNHKIYFDYGSATLDSRYKPYQQAIDRVMQTKGYNKKNWVTREFIGEDHSEKAWSKRLYLPLLFLLSK